MGGLETGALHFVKYRWFKKSQMPYKFIKTYWCPVILWLVRIITTIKCTFRWWKIKTSGQSNLTNRPHRRRTWTVVPILYNGLLIAPQNCPFPWGIWTPSNTWFLGPTRVLNPNGISIGSADFAGLTSMTDRQTDRPCNSVCNNRPHPASAAMWPKRHQKPGLWTKLILSDTTIERRVHKVLQTWGGLNNSSFVELSTAGLCTKQILFKLTVN